MLQSFIIILREGFESFLLVAVILSYLRKSQQPATGAGGLLGIMFALLLSGGLGYLLFQNATGNDLVNGISGRRSPAFSATNRCAKAFWACSPLSWWRRWSFICGAPEQS